MDLDDHKGRVQRLTGLSIARLSVLILIGAFVVGGYAGYALRAERQAYEAANQTVDSMQAARFAFKVSQLSYRGVLDYRDAVTRGDVAVQMQAINLIDAAIGFANSPFASDAHRIQSLDEVLQEMRAIMVQAGIEPNEQQLLEINALIARIDLVTSRYEQDTYNRFLGEFSKLQSNDHQSAANLRITTVSAATGLLLIAILLFFMRAEQAATNRRIEAEHASRAKSAFLANMSHEIRTPMNGIVGLTELLSQSPLNDDQHKMVENIQDSSHFLLQIIDDILDAAKIDAGKLELEDAAFAFLTAVEKTAESLATQARRSHVHFLLFMDAEIPDYVYGDALRLRQVLLNLLSNAIKFSNGTEMAPKTVELHVEVPSDQPEGANVVRFRVVDYGIGMSPETIEKIFLPFNQGEETTTRRFGGTGLGLVITRNLVELMGGQLSLDSTLGRGSTFTVTLPLEPAPGDANLADISGLKLILLIDRAEYRSVTGAYMAKRGADVRFAHTQEDLFPLAEQADDQTVLMLALDAASKNMQLVDDLIEANPDLRLLVLDPTRGTPKGLVGEKVYVSYRFPMHPTDMLRGLAILAGRTQEGRAPQDQHETDRQRVLPLDRPARLLVIEDNPLNLSVITRQLELLGCSYETAVNGAEGLNKWRQADFDLVLTDCQMPEMDGLEMTRHIRQIESGRGREPVPIVAISANAQRDEINRAFDAGVSDYLTKPLQIDQLRNALSKWGAASQA